MSNGGMATLDDRGVIQLAGPEARAFLQRLVTNDVEHLAAGEARYAALLTPQGKITSDFFVIPDPTDPEVMTIEVAAALAADLVKKLGLYRLRARIEIRDRSGDLGVFVAEPGAQTPAGASLYADPRHPALWRRGIAARPALAACYDAAALAAYHAARIRAGVPEGGVDFAYGDAFPHDANLDRLNGVDFRKGCYVGQEVVSRVEHRGTARRRVVRLAFEGAPPATGTDITMGGLSVGTMGSSIEGLGLGLVRLDRIGEAAGASDQPVLAGSTPVRLVA